MIGGVFTVLTVLSRRWWEAGHVVVECSGEHKHPLPQSLHANPAELKSVIDASIAQNAQGFHAFIPW